MRPIKVDKFLIATMNKRSVIDMIRTKGPINKAEIARVTDLSIPTVMKLTDEFIKNGLIHVTGKGESSGGKRPELLEFISNVYYIVGVDVGRNTLKALIMDLDGSVISKKVKSTGDDTSPEIVIKSLIELIEMTIADSGIQREKILGMGIGMPGLLDIESGLVLFSPDFQWENVDLVEPIQNYFSMSIHLENSNRAQAMGEKWFGAGINSDYFICVNIGHGIGSAIVEQGEFYRGSCGSSGELGHITMEKNGPRCECGNYGCLEVLASGHAIAEKAKDQIKSGSTSQILDMAMGSIENIDAKVVFEASKLGDPLAKGLVKDAVEYIGIGLATYINLLDPDMIILAGGVVNAGDVLIDGIKEVIKVRQMKFAGRKVKIRVAKLGADATAVGAASLVLKRFIESGGNPEIRQ